VEIVGTDAVESSARAPVKRLTIEDTLRWWWRSVGERFVVQTLQPLDGSSAPGWSVAADG
jgi:hypothetical protein